MDYRFYDRDLDYLEKTGVNVSIKELKRRFGIQIDGAEEIEGATPPDYEGDVSEIAVQPAQPDGAMHQYAEPKFDIDDEKLASDQLDAFLDAAKE